MEISCNVLNSGENAIFNCTVSGTPIGNIRWFKNGEVLMPTKNGNIKLLDPLLLQINDVTRHDKGMYQCFVENEKENTQGSAELRLGDLLDNDFIAIDQRIEMNGNKVAQWFSKLREEAIIAPSKRYVTKAHFSDDEFQTITSINKKKLSDCLRLLLLPVEKARDEEKQVKIKGLTLELEGKIYTAKQLEQSDTDTDSGESNNYSEPSSLEEEEEEVIEEEYRNKTNKTEESRPEKAKKKRKKSKTPSPIGTHTRSNKKRR
ncbi:unnamed protein product [Ceutorhynchus assimilis]|uniref:Ig-like domain-containing protein n=1 Tax=Ceutorhynchus assimilis TaxID=467358 RepID=A0A9N9M9V9_9CUCU|nr:unnamed protein product [Ceutorhynchus assimilis]